MPPDGETSDDLVNRHFRWWSQWVVLYGHRLHIAGMTIAVLFTFLAVVGLSSVAPFQNMMPLYYAFGGLISGNLTLITVVVAITQLLLSREFRTPEELQTQIKGIVDYRRDIESSSGRIAPVEPMGFLRLIVERIREEAQSLGGLAISATDNAVSDELDPVIARLTEKSDKADELLQKSDASTFEVLSTTLSTNYAHEINELRRINREYDRLPDTVEDSVELLVHELENIEIARQYFKSIYLQEELATLSRFLFYVGFGSLAIVTAGLFSFTAASGASVPHSYLSVFVAALVAVGLAPLALLFAFVIRIAVVVQRTAATLPFTTPAQEK